MKYFKFRGLLQIDGWISPGYVGVEEKGIISSVSHESPEDSSNLENVDGYAIPGFQNAHSHAFQYAMAGITENHPPGRSPDDFWSWREAMYKIALSISPDQMEAIATILYAEMLKHGYTQVAEFHYLHHDVNGNYYNNPAEMGQRLVSAAHKSGIKLALIPIFYKNGGFGEEPSEQQRRFISTSVSDYLKLWEASLEATIGFDNASVGIGFHSLRAVDELSIKQVLSDLPDDLPVHIHVAEQLKEVEEAIQFFGKRPVRWMLDKLELNSRFNLVHATHLDENEVRDLALSQSNVVLCPSTEGNLGDGIFRLREYQDMGGTWSIGTDSHIGLNPLEELRILDYGQRLTSHRRDSFHSIGFPDSSRYGYHQALIAGREAMGNKSKAYFEVGQSLDALIIDASKPLIDSSSEEHLLSSYIYSGDVSWNLGTLINGEWMVKKGKHLKEEFLLKEFKQAIKELNNR